MGTRACFFIGDPRDYEKRKYLGSIAWNGHPENFQRELLNITHEKDFIKWVDSLKERDDFAFPDHGFAFPWVNDLFLTDQVYAFYKNKVFIAFFHYGLWEVKKYFILNWDYIFEEDETCLNIKAPSEYNKKQPDSIMVFKIGGK
jgi:hypothetical protein